MLRTLRAIRAVRFDWTAIGRLTSAGFYLLTPEVENRKARFHTRKITPRLEDPATGSAAGCAAAWFVKHGLARSGEKVLIEQGSEIKRPSEIVVSAARNGERVTGVRVGGQAVKVMQGSLTLA